MLSININIKTGSIFIALFGILCIPIQPASQRKIHIQAEMKKPVSLPLHTRADISGRADDDANVSSRRDPSLDSWELDIGSWNVSSESNGNGTRLLFCILFKAAIQLDINYYQSDGKRYIARINMPATRTSATGSCAERAQFINLSWPIRLPNGTVAQGTIRFVFLNYFQQQEDASTKEKQEVEVPLPNTYTISNIKVTYPLANLPGAENPEVDFIAEENHPEDGFITNSDYSYKCSMVELESANFTLRLADFQYQAFLNTSSSSSPSDPVKFSKALNCQVTEGKSINEFVVVAAVAGGYLALFIVIYWHKTYISYEDEFDENQIEYH